MNTSEKTGQLEARIEKWKRDLIDLTNRNALLNFRPKRTNSVQFFENPHELFDSIFNKTKTLNMENLKTPYFNQVEKILSSDADDQVKKEKIEEEKVSYKKVLSKLRVEARTRFNEQGIQTMYLVFGVLNWKEQSNGKDFIAPLILVPVELTRSNANQPFHLRMVDDEIVLNPFLAHKLREEKGIILDEIGDKEDFDLLNMWQEIFEKVNYLEGWAVLPDTYLSMFSFNKLVMYKDLENNRELLESHPLIRAISGESMDNESNIMDLSGIPDESALDQAVPSQESFQVLDADSSQHQAVLAAKKGVSFVLQGPPGTGKSQTISNIIAECMAMNKKVLFVSEKMAALEVVKSRLEQVGLGDFCLELHSHKANKRALLDAFNDVMNKRPERKQIDGEMYAKINSLRDQLNSYADKLHKVRQPIGKSVYEVHGLLAKLDAIPEVLFEFEIDNEFNLEYISNLLSDLERFRGQTILVNHSPVWKGFSQTVYSLELGSNVESMLRKYLINMCELRSTAEIIEQRFGMKVDSINELRQNRTILEAAMYSPKPPRHWFRLDSIHSIIQQAKDYQDRTIDFLDKKNSMSRAFYDGILELPLQRFKEGLFSESKDLFMAFGSKDPIVLINDQYCFEEIFEKSFRSIEGILVLDEVRKKFGLPNLETINDAKILLTYLSILSENPKPTKRWFEDFEQVKATIRQIKLQYEEFKTKQFSLFKKYNTTVFDLDLFNLRQMIEAQGKEILPYFTSVNQSSDDSSVFSKRKSIQESIKKFLALREQFQQTKTLICDVFELADLSNFKAIANLKSIMERIAKDPKPQDSWFQIERHHEIYSLIQDSKNVHSKYHKEILLISGLYEDEIIDEHVLDIFDRFENKYQSPWRIFNRAYRKDRKWLTSKLKQKSKYDFDNLFKHVRSAKRVIDHKNWIQNKQHEYRTLFGWHYKGLNTNWDTIEEALLTVRGIIEKFNGSKVPNSLREILINPAGQLELLTMEYNRLVSIIGLMEDVLVSLKNEFPSLFFAWANTPVDQWSIQEVITHLDSIQIKLDAFFVNIDLMLENRKPGTVSHLTLRDLLKDIDLGLSVIQLENTFADQESVYHELIGTWYQGEQTPWDRLEKASSDFEGLFQFKTSVPELYRKLLIDGSQVPRDQLLGLDQSIKELEESLVFIGNQIPQLFEDMKNIPNLQWEMIRISDRLQWFKGMLTKWYLNYDAIRPEVKKKYNAIVDVKNDLEHAILVQSKKQKLDGELDFIKEMFGGYFSGYATNWQLIFDALAWLDEWLKYFNSGEVSEELLDYVAQGADYDSKQRLSSVVEACDNLLTDYDTVYGELSKYFTEDALQIDGMSFDFSSFEKYLSWIEIRLNSLEFLEEWVRYGRLEKRIKEAKLSSYLEQLQVEKPINGTFIELFQKRFYRKWLDRIYQEEELLYDFEIDKVHESVSKFRDYDQKSLQTNAKRIQEKLEENRIHAMQSLAYRFEQSVLLHEIGKKKRHISIRKLLSQTSGLALEIKPCFLMSPLSVCQFLDAKRTTFDVVIFDEASQIFPEDAIGAIIRAPQVIIVGDNKQLPPTDFFKSAGVGEEFKDEDDVDYESILDECMYVLQNMRLRWHYRSRHESLITFSNQAFYQSSLITFPSAEYGEDLGVKFIHVPDGKYDRGGTRSNRREAEVTAQLVFEHFRKYPKRSLGVIAFSDAQASEISDQIDTLRRQNPGMETFFKEGHPDEFFVKSLENVQGDERDVIFFSVGYGKAPDGTLHMNFGPLSKNGGERRLNVAVTRAKYHVKLISSLLPQDIPLERTQSIGVHRLREYMEMAISGSLPTYASSEVKKIFDSPFEEDVYEVLLEMGYDVHTQVGCSGYRVDLAVVDPLKPDCYLLGIECDGKTYHSSKVARDRDRLRQQVLENLGWKIHRIWSQEWFKRRKSEMTKLKNLLNKLRYE